MRRLLLLLFFPLSLHAQIDDARQAIREYRFFDATCILGDIEEGDSLYVEAQPLLAEAKIAQSSMNAVERVTVIDSVCVPASKWQACIPLSPECGTLTPRGYTPALADRFYSADGQLHVNHYGYNGQGDKVLTQETLALPDSMERRNPFMMTDGLTLYFAARGTGSMGGYDIFMTRYDLDERQYLKPQNIGMPFNSPANDLFYCIDEDNHLGYFVTDRNMPPDTVCVYTFIPSDVRRIYDSNLYDTRELTSLARLDSLRATWHDAPLVLAACAKLDSLRQPRPKTKPTTPAPSFIVSPTLTYHAATDFRSREARAKYTYYIEGQADLTKKRQQLDSLRRRYKKGQDGEEIRSLEQEVEELTAALTAQAYEMRRLEHETLNH